MKLTIKEAMKKITLIDKEIERLTDFEERESKISYVKDEEKEKSTYNYKEISSKLDLLEDEKRNLKIQIFKLNSTFKTEYKNLTIQELLILLAQKNNKISRLEDLAYTKKLQRKVLTDGSIEYIECLYDPKEIENEIILLQNQVIDIQIAIDKANLTASFEI